MPPSLGSRRGPRTSTGAALAKLALRDQLTTARNRRPVAEIGLFARAVAGHLLEAPEVRRAATVAAYVSIGAEPGTSWLLAGLTSAGKRVILPVLLPDGDLDWAVHTGDDALAPARLGLLEPTSPRLGVDAVGTADVVIVPGLATSSSGLRLGRGGGSYDRALGRVPVGTFTCVVLYDGEVGVEVPVEAHDRPVSAAVTPSGSAPLLVVCVGHERQHVVAGLVDCVARVRPRQRLAGDHQVGLVGVVVVEGVTGDAGQVDPARVVEVGQ